MFRYCGTGAMINLIKILKDLEALSFKRTESASAEQSLDEGSLQSSDEGSDPRIQTLQIIINILDSEQNMGTFLTRSDFFLYQYIYIKLYLCLSVCQFGWPIITHEPLYRLASNFDSGTRENHGNVLNLVLSLNGSTVIRTKLMNSQFTTKCRYSAGGSMTTLHSGSFARQIKISCS